MPENISGEYWKIQSVSGCCAASSLNRRAWLVASSTMPSSSRPSTTLRITGAVALYRCTMARARALQRLERAADQRLARLGQHLDRDVVGDQVLVDQLADEVEFDLRRRGKADLDLLEADLHQRLEHAQLARRCPSARSAPGCRRAGRRCTRSGGRVSTASGQVRSFRRDRREGAVLAGGVLQHGWHLSLVR